MRRLLVLLPLLLAAAPADTGTIEGPSGDVRLGGVVTFETTFDGHLKGKQGLYVEVRCTQDGTVVYADVNPVGESFKLGGDSSPWLDNGGSATCTASLLIYPDIAALDSTEPFIV